MPKRLLPLSVLFPVAALMVVCFVGCAEAPPAGVAYASVAPPAAVVEVEGVAPGPDFIWIGGHHVWGGGAYSWHAGSWERRPRAGVAWVPGTWRHHRRGWYWRDGRWR